MTLKKFLKHVSKDQLIEINNSYNTDFGYKSEIRKKYVKLKVKDAEMVGETLIIEVKTPKPKRSTDNKAYKKLQKEYFQEHKDEIGLVKKKDCCSCKHEYKAADDFPCSECIHVHTDRWEKAD